MPFKKKPALYSVWQSMKQRCYNPNARAYANYGGRGIVVCQRWHTYKNFAEDMLPSYEQGLTLDRIDNDGNYEPENCRWATKLEQQRNQRTTIVVVVDGVEYKAIELAQMARKKPDTIVKRVERGLPFDLVVSQLRQFPDNHAASIRKAVAARVARQRSATHCRHGHERSEKNTAITPQGWARCRVCHRERERKRKSLGKS